MRLRGDAGVPERRAANAENAQRDSRSREKGGDLYKKAPESVKIASSSEVLAADGDGRSPAGYSA